MFSPTKTLFDPTKTKTKVFHFKKGSYESCAQLALVVHVQFLSAQLHSSELKKSARKVNIYLPFYFYKMVGTLGLLDLLVANHLCIEFEFGGSRAVSKCATPPSV